MSERPPRSALLFLIGGAVALGVGLAVLGEDPSPNRDEMLAYWRAEDPACTQGLKAEDVDVAVDLSAQWLLANQLSHGPFVDSRDWRTGEGDETVVPMRQAIALWALARYHHSQPDPAVASAVERGLSHWQMVGTDHAASTAVLSMAADLAGPKWHPWRDRLLNDLVTARTQTHRTRARLADAEARPDAEADAAALAALVSAAASNRTDLVEQVKPVWRATWMHDVDRPRKRRRDPAPTKLVYPWAPLALEQLAESGWLDTEDAGPQLTDLAIWMIDDHQTLRRSGNTAYAAVGLAVAARWARAHEAEQAAKLSCATDRSLARLMSWQAGHPRALASLADARRSSHISGGVQTGPDDARQRLDYASYVLVALLEWRAGN